MRCLLFPISLIIRSGCQIKKFFYNMRIFTPYKAPFPVISIGNISFGGSEKTPLAMNLLSFLLKHGLKPALITRGYKGKWEKSGGILSDGENIYGSWEESGDEPFMVAQRIPQAGIFIGKNRSSSCEKAKHLGFDAGFLDDGFQHIRLHRDLDIVLYDPSEKIALREPVSSLKRAHIIFVKKKLDTKSKEKIRERFHQASVLEYSVISKGFYRLKDKTRVPAEYLKGKRILVFCGIARPERFFLLLEAEGIKPHFFLKFSDHHPYSPPSLKKIAEKSKKLHAEALITTEKDAVKIYDSQDFLKIPVYYQKIDLEVEEIFYKKILTFLKI